MSQSTFGFGGAEGAKEEKGGRRGGLVTVVILAVVLSLASLVATGKLKLANPF